MFLLFNTNLSDSLLLDDQSDTRMNMPPFVYHTVHLALYMNTVAHILVQNYIYYKLEREKSSDWLNFIPGRKDLNIRNSLVNGCLQGSYLIQGLSNEELIIS